MHAAGVCKQIYILIKVFSFFYFFFITVPVSFAPSLFTILFFFLLGTQALLNLFNLGTCFCGASFVFNCKKARQLQL